MTAYVKGEHFKCPHCRYLNEDPVEDFVVPMRYKASVDKCDECGGKVAVIEYEPGKFEVTKE